MNIDNSIIRARGKKLARLGPTEKFSIDEIDIR